MTTYNRPHYFKATIKSLESCGDDVSRLHIFDDCSTILYPSVMYPIYRNESNVGVFRNAVKGITFGFDEYKDIDRLLYIQDDVELSFKCITIGNNTADLIVKDGYKLGVLSLFHRSKKAHDTPYIVMRVGHPGAVCWIVTREFWNAFLNSYTDTMIEIAPNDARKRHFVRDLCDYKICRAAQILGFTVAYTRFSLVQHIGDVSSITGNDMSFCRSTQYVGDLK